MVITHDERMVFVSGHTCGRPESVHSRIDLLETTLLPFIHWLRKEYYLVNKRNVSPEGYSHVEMADDEILIREFRSQ